MLVDIRNGRGNAQQNVEVMPKQHHTKCFRVRLSRKTRQFVFNHWWLVGAYRGEVRLTLHVDHILVKIYVEDLLQKGRIELFDERRGRPAEVLDRHGDVEGGEDGFADVFGTHERHEALVLFFEVFGRARGEEGHGGVLKRSLSVANKEAVVCPHSSVQRGSFQSLFGIPGFSTGQGLCFLIQTRVSHRGPTTSGSLNHDNLISITP
jgi:hypothetical protein